MNSTTIKNGDLELDFLSFGGAVTRLSTPDRAGRRTNVVLGFKSPEEYLKPQPYFGALIGRFGGRINNARFSLDDVEYKLTANNGRHSLAGGAQGFDKKEWSVEVLGGEKTARLTLASPDGDEGYPGQLSVCVTYSLTDKATFRLDYEATTDRPTVLNLTNQFQSGGPRGRNDRQPHP
jgi:aldose 1-epimerase